MDRSVEWRHLISEHLGRHHLKGCRELRLNLLSVDCGLKPALLLDFAVRSASHVRAFLDAVKQAGLLKNDLLVVTIDVDILIVCPAAFERDNLTDLEKLFSSVAFIDVSASLDSPRVISGTSNCLQPTKTCFCRFLSEENGARGITALPVSFSNGDSANPSTLFGLFLGYPVVYFYDMSLASQDNCLSMVPLVNFAVTGTVLQSGDQALSARDHTVLSFTVPEVFVEEVEGRVVTWFDGKRDSGGWGGVFAALKLDRRVVQLPRVCL